MSLLSIQFITTKYCSQAHNYSPTRLNEGEEETLTSDLYSILTNKIATGVMDDSEFKKSVF